MTAAMVPTMVEDLFKVCPAGECGCLRLRPGHVACIPAQRHHSSLSHKLALLQSSSWTCTECSTLLCSRTPCALESQALCCEQHVRPTICAHQRHSTLCAAWGQVVVDLPEHLRSRKRAAAAAGPSWRRAAAPTVPRAAMGAAAVSHAASGGGKFPSTLSPSPELGESVCTTAASHTALGGRELAPRTGHAGDDGEDAGLPGEDALPLDRQPLPEPAPPGCPEECTWSSGTRQQPEPGEAGEAANPADLGRAGLGRPTRGRASAAQVPESGAEGLTHRTESCRASGSDTGVSNNGAESSGTVMGQWPGSVKRAPDPTLSQVHLDAVAGLDVGGWRALEIGGKPSYNPRVYGSAGALAPPRPPGLPPRAAAAHALVLNLAQLSGSEASRQSGCPTGSASGLAGVSRTCAPRSYPAGRSVLPTRAPNRARATAAAHPHAKNLKSGPTGAGLPAAETPRLFAAATAHAVRQVGGGAAAVKGRAAPALEAGVVTGRALGIGLGEKALNPRLAALHDVGRSLLGLNADPALVAAFLRARSAAENLVPNGTHPAADGDRKPDIDAESVC